MSNVSDSDVDALASGSAFCVKPWTHCHVTTDGSVRACCMSAVTFGNLRKNTLSEIWNGEAIRRFRLAHLTGQKVAGCEQCYIPEANGVFSLRQLSNQQFLAHTRAAILNTNTDGRAPQSKPIDFDIRFSNICNFKCRTCNHDLSSSWYLDEGKLRGGQRRPKAIIRAFDTPHEFWAAFDGFIDDVEKLYFAGGEPLLQEEHYQILAALEARGKFDVLIHYNTNLSVLGYGGIDVTKLWSKFHNLHIAASLDGSNERGELIRHGQSWPTVLENRARLRVECPHASFWVACAVSALNAWHVPEFHRELVDSNFIAPGEFELNIVQTPRHLSMQALPLETKHAIAGRFDAHADWLRRCGQMAIADGFNAVVRYMYARDESRRLPQLQDFCRKLDELRGESTIACLPELSAILR